MKTLQTRVVVVASTPELRCEHYYLRLWLAFRNMPFSRRQWLNEIAGNIYDFEGSILCADGKTWPVPEIDDVFGGPDGRVISLYKEAKDGYPRRRCVRAIERLRVIDLYFRIKYPRIARHFGR